jgi:hypothetical protein
MRFDSFNAHEMAARSVAARKAARERRQVNRDREAALESLQAGEQGDGSDQYVAKRLLHVREHLDLLDERLRKAAPKGDSKQIRDISVAVKNLSDMEFDLAGRPKPGNRRHATERPKRRPNYWELPGPISTPAVEIGIAETAGLSGTGLRD